MALVWRKQTRDKLYELRNAGKSLRLYTNGVFHTQYNPDHAVTGSVWDLLLLPALMRPPGSIRRVLVLGVGGGAVFHLLQRYIQPQSITGVELDPVHVYLAKRFFHLASSRIELVTADAIAWVHAYRGEPFDLIIEDLFMEQDGEPVAVQAANRDWFRQLLRHLKPTGVVVRNFVSRRELLQSAPLTDAGIGGAFPTILSLSGRDLNRVGVFFRVAVETRDFRRRLQQVPGIGPALRNKRLYFRLQRLK